MDKSKLKRFALILKDRFTGVEMNSLPVIIAYYLFLSLFPLLIALGNILPMLGFEIAGLMPYLATVVPPDVLPVLESIMTDLVATGSGGLFSVGLVAAIWSASKGVTHLQRGVNMAYGVPRSGSFIAKRLISLITILLVLVLLAAFALVFGFGELLLTSLEPIFSWAGALNDFLTSWRWPVVVVFLFCMLLIVYRVTPDVQGLRLRAVLPGAAFSTAGLLALAQLFTLYLQFFTSRFSSYGTLGAFFVLMFWLNFSAALVVLGAVLNATISEYRHGKAREAVGRLDHLIDANALTLLKRLRTRLTRKKNP